MKPTSLALNYFDFIVLGVLTIGFLRGRKRGMSEELLDLLKIAAMVFAGGLFYKPFGAFLKGFTGLPLLVMYVSAYILLLIGVAAVFSLVKRVAGEKLVGSDTFGRLEYYLGMLSGMVRWSGILFILLALLNARLIPDAEYDAKFKADKELYGDNYFTIFSLGFHQRAVFRKSVTGPHIVRYMGNYLIEPTLMNDVMQKRDGMGRQREREIEDLMKK